MARIGLIDVDGHNYPNLALMKLSAWHKAQGDTVEWYFGFEQYDRVYMSKVFDDSYSPPHFEPCNTKELIKGGTGYGLGNKLPDEVERMYPDYSLYPELTKDTAYGFLSRGCPNACGFCIVSEKEGRCSTKVADLSQWWDGQKNIVLMDPNLLACREHMELIQQLEASGAWVDINQGLDARLVNPVNAAALRRVKLKEIHFAWDLMENSKRIIRGLNIWKRHGKKNRHGEWGTVYILVNYNTTMTENLFRIEKCWEMGFAPYVMVYDKPHAPKEVIRLQRWCNSKQIFKSCKWQDYKG